MGKNTHRQGKKVYMHHIPNEIIQKHKENKIVCDSTARMFDLEIQALASKTANI